MDEVLSHVAEVRGQSGRRENIRVGKCLKMSGFRFQSHAFPHNFICHAAATKESNEKQREGTKKYIKENLISGGLNTAPKQTRTFLATKVGGQNSRRGDNILLQ